MSLKEKLMNKMMDNHFEKMSTEEKKQMMDTMMDKFFSSMSESERKEMMSGMMPKMMGQMMSGSENSPMMGMMSMMMGKRGDKENKKMPWDMCGEMMTNFTETANSAKYANSELRSLFEEWCTQIETELLSYLKESGGINLEAISQKFNLSPESVKYLLNRLASKGLIDYKI
jgi:hypothetical protein